MIRINSEDNRKYRTGEATQPKWFIDNVWYKADDSRYEGLAETLAADILKKSNIEYFVDYQPEVIEYSGFALHKDKTLIGNIKDNLFQKPKRIAGCKSLNFLQDDKSLILSSSFFRLLPSLSKPSKNAEEFILKFVATVDDITGLTEFRRYFTKMLEFDRLILNPDRNFGNICFLENSDHTYAYAPVFDNGRAFALSDFFHKPGVSVEQIVTVVNKMHTSPFGNFDEQVHIMEDLSGGKQLKLSYTYDDLDNVLNKCSDVYSDEILDRARKIFWFQMQKHKDFFYRSV